MFKICKGYSRIRPEELFHFSDRGEGTRGHSLKLVKVRCTRDSRRHFFSNRVITRWNQLDQGAVDATRISAFKSKLRDLDILGWASSWTSPLSPRPPGGIPAGEAAQGEYKVRRTGTSLHLSHKIAIYY